MSKFPIPEQYRAQLVFSPPADHQSDAEILAAVSTFPPVTSEKNIWAYWHSGATSMPTWCQRNVINWVRTCDPTWTVRVLDKVPNSTNNALVHVDPNTLPAAFVNDTMYGPYVGQHSADFCRGAYLHEYGGVWMDVGVILIRDLDALCWDILADPASPYQTCIPWLYENATANHFIAARRRDPFILRWHKLFMHLWQGRTSHENIIAHPLLRFCQNRDYSKSRGRGFRWEFEANASTTFNYLAQVFCWSRVSAIEDCGDEERFNGYEYWLEKTLLLDALQECWGAESVVGFDAVYMFELLTTRMDEESERAREAEVLVWRLLTKSCFQKVARAKKIWKGKSLGALLDERDGDSVDAQEGTFAELLRYGSVNFRQTRKVEYVAAPRIDHLLMGKGLYET